MNNQFETIHKQRDDTFDIIKGICILLMIVGHCAVSTTLGNVIYSFHMPVFFFIAGYFFKQCGLWRTIIVGIKRLLVPFSVFFVTCFLVAHVFEWFGCFSDVIESRIDYNNPVNSFLLMGKCPPIWFLVSLFWCRLLFVPISKIKNDIIMLVGVLFVAIISANFYYYIKLPLVLIPSLTAIGFYAVGYLLATRNFLSDEKMWKYLPLLLGAWGICLSTGKRLNIVCNEYRSFYILDLLGALGVFISIYCVVNKCNTKAISWTFLKWCGINSLIILCVHSVELNFVNYDAVRRLLLPVFWPYEIYLIVVLRLVFDLGVTFVLTRSKYVKRYIFAQYN